MPAKPLAGITDRLASELRGWLELVTDGNGCLSCTATLCPIHRRRRSTLEALADLERGKS